MLFKSLARDTALYGSADFVTKLVAFFTFPIIAAALSPADFGTLDIIMTTVGLAGLFVNSGLNNAVQRYYWDKDILPAERPTIVSAGFYLQTILGLLGVLITFLALPTIMSLTAPLNLSFSLYGLIAATFLMITLQATQYIQDVIRLHFSPGRFMLFSLLGRVLTLRYGSYCRAGL
ncbi:MAG: oligosaccharide flippase family protein [Alphaproteobacteria bacterium]